MGTVGPSRRSFITIFLLALAIRGYKLSQIPAGSVIPSTSWELSSIAISLVETGQYADPYMIPTGPTAHLPPIYPALFALIFRLYGLTATAGYVTLLIIALTGSLLYALLPWYSERVGAGSAAGITGGIAGALFVEWPGHGEYLTALVLVLLLATFHRRWGHKTASWGGSFILGLATGAAFHLQPALLPVIASCLAFEVWQRRNQRQWAEVGVILLGVVLACAPWAWRNYMTFDTFFFIRSNFGLELRMGNHAGAAAAMEVMDALQEPAHPRTHFAEARKVRDLGEVVYMRQARGEALTWIKANPGEFLQLTVQRIAHFWAGPLHRPEAAAGIFALTLLALIGAWRTLPTLQAPGRAVLLIPLITYPLVYYFVPYMARYRAPIDWILLIFGGAALWDGIKRLTGVGKPATTPTTAGDN